MHIEHWNNILCRQAGVTLWASKSKRQSSQVLNVVINNVIVAIVLVAIIVLIIGIVINSIGRDMDTRNGNTSAVILARG